MNVELVAVGAAIAGLGLTNIASIVRANRSARWHVLSLARLRGHSRERLRQLDALQERIDADHVAVKELERLLAAPVAPPAEFAADWERRRRDDAKAAKRARHAEAERAREAERRRLEAEGGARRVYPGKLGGASGRPGRTR